MNKYEIGLEIRSLALEIGKMAFELKKDHEDGIFCAALTLAALQMSKTAGIKQHEQLETLDSLLDLIYKFKE